MRRSLERCLEQARDDGELAALAWGIGVLATFEPRALARPDIERELGARVARLRRK